MKKIILDTDIGNDVDDLLALIMLAKMDEIRLLGITTVYGDTKQEAQMCRYVLDLLGRIDVPVFAGESFPLNGGGILRGAHVGGGFPPDLYNVQVNPHLDAVEFLIEQSKLYQEELEILSIGPLTNIAKAVISDPDFPKRVKQITMMGGMVYPESCPEWLEIISKHNGEYNISCDLEASRIVFDAGFAITLIPLDVTTKVFFTTKHQEYFSRLPFGLGKLVSSEMGIWWMVTSRMNDEDDYRNNPHDPMAVVALYDERFFKFKRGSLSIGASFGLGGMTLFEASPAGSANVAIEVDPSIINEITKKIIC